MADNQAQCDLKPSVNNMTVRVFVRAAGLDFAESDVWGNTRIAGIPGHEPGAPDADDRVKDLPKGALWESCAIMQYLCNKHGLEKFYPKAPAKRAMIDSAMFYLIGTLYPLWRAPPIRHSASRNMPARSAQATRMRRQDGSREGGRRRDRRAARGVPHILHGRQAFHRRRQNRRSPTSGWRRRWSSLRPSTMRCLPGRRPIWRPWRRRSARPIRSRPPTCAAISTT